MSPCINGHQETLDADCSSLHAFQVSHRVSSLLLLFLAHNDDDVKHLRLEKCSQDKVFSKIMELKQERINTNEILLNKKNTLIANL